MSARSRRRMLYSSNNYMCDSRRCVRNFSDYLYDTKLSVVVWVGYTRELIEKVFVATGSQFAGDRLVDAVFTSLWEDLADAMTC